MITRDHHELIAMSIQRHTVCRGLSQPCPDQRGDSEPLLPQVVGQLRLAVGGISDLPDGARGQHLWHTAVLEELHRPAICCP
jgi:hypothetical protein